MGCRTSAHISLHYCSDNVHRCNPAFRWHTFLVAYNSLEYWASEGAFIPTTPDLQWSRDLRTRVNEASRVFQSSLAQCLRESMHHKLKRMENLYRLRSMPEHVFGAKVLFILNAFDIPLSHSLMRQYGLERIVVRHADLEEVTIDYISSVEQQRGNIEQCSVDPNKDLFILNLDEVGDRVRGRLRRGEDGEWYLQTDGGETYTFSNVPDSRPDILLQTKSYADQEVLAVLHDAQVKNILPLDTPHSFSGEEDELGQE